MRSVVVALILAGAAFIGCSDDATSPTTPPPGTDGGTITPPPGPITQTKQITLPSGIWTKKTNIEHYEVFATHEAALAWFETFKANDPRGPGGETVVPLADPRYADVEKEVAAVWAGFVDVFASDTEQLPVPWVILTDVPAADAYAVYDAALGRSPNAFVIQTGALGKDVIALRGLIAHELTHHVLKHGWPGVIEKTEKYYLSTAKAGSGFGFDQVDDKPTAAVARRYIALAQGTGDYPLTQWNGFNRPTSAVEQYRVFVHDKAKATTPTPCADADTARNALAVKAFPLLDPTTASVVATTEDLTALDALTRDYVAKETACAGGYAGTFFQAAAEKSGATEPQVRAGATADEIAANDGATNAYDAIARLTKRDDEVLLGLDTAKTRYYTFEEQADDVGVVILFHIALDPRGLRTFLNDTLLTDAGRTKCTSLVAAGEPPYGILSDPHHSTCWRIWHADALVTYLSSP